MNVLSEKAKKFTEAFEHCMKNEPLALRNAMGMNRQQFKSMQREQKKMEEAMKKLTPIQFKLIDMLMRQERRKVEQEVTERTIALNSCVNAALTETVDWTCDEIDKFWKVVNEMIPGDIQARSEMQKMNEKERVEMEAKVREFIIEALEADKKVREIKEELKFKFPKLSSAQRTNAVKEIKEEWLEQKGAERIAKIISGEEDKEVEKEQVKKEIVVNEKTKSAEEKEVVLMEAISVPTISEQLQGNLINFKKDKEAIYNIILEYENFISAKREELEVIKEKEKNVEKAIELLSSVGI
ncbi:hypothetical protein [Clostridium sp.]|uniref:hypothetical protein n=1 Tax=Clostridium sp. TaxID=1506 RepID=UPI002A8E5541|nr:hypothetical protein [Clostridium sp.]